MRATGQRRATALLATALVALGAAGCGGDASGDATTSTPGKKLAVVATTTQVADFARNVGGDRITVTQILKPNVDPHDYEPSPADVAAIGKADVVLESGVGLESWLDQTVSSSGFDGPVVDTSIGVTIRPGNGEEDEKAGDPHIWHNPANAKIVVSNIEAALSKADAGDAKTFAANAAAYTVKLDRLDRDIAAKIATLPADNRKLVTNHDAFGYYIDRYKMEFVGSIIPSFDTSAELSGTQLQELVAKIKATGTKAVFSESSLPPKTAEAIGKEAGVKVEAGEDSLYGDTLGPAGSAGATYLEMETHNTDTIVGALRA